MRWLLLSAVAWAAPPMAEPAVSPDGKEIAFVSGGDIWAVAARGGEARLLISHSAHDSRPMYSPDGKRIAFLSNRSGATSIYVHEFTTGTTHRLTFVDVAHMLDSWSRDGEWIYFSSGHGEIPGMLDIYRVRATGGTPMPVSADRFMNEYHAAPSPDGGKLLFVARGVGAAQWWRKGRSHLDESEIWLLNEAAAQKDTRILGRGAKQLWPQWTPGGGSFYFVSDRGGPQNLHLFTLGKGEKPVTRFTNGRVLYPSLSADGKVLAFERDLGIWTLDTASGNAAQVPITLRGAPAMENESEWRRASEGFGQLAVSPDGKKIAFSYWGELWAASAGEGGEAFRVTKSVEIEGDPVWSPDSNSVAFTAAGDGEYRVLVHDFLKNGTRVAGHGAGPAWSPDGKRLAYTREEQLFAGETALGVKTRSFAWSPDGEWIAALVRDSQGFTNAHAIRADGSARHPLSWLANTNGSHVQWTPDGKSLLFLTSQRTEPPKIAMVDLVPREPEYQESKFRELFTKPAAAGKPAVRIQPEGLRERLRILPIEMPVEGPKLSRDGKQLAFVSGSTLYSMALNGRPRAVLRGGSYADLDWDAANKSIFYVQQGKLYSVAIDNPQAKAIPVSVTMESAFEDTRRAVFQQAWMMIRDRFYDPGFHGVDWNGEIKRTYGEAVGGARTMEETRRLLNLMVGELNASHLGARAGATPSRTAGYLGVDWDVTAYEREGKWRVAAVVPNGPAALAGLVKGDLTTHLNGTELKADTVLEKLLQLQAGREVVMRRDGKPEVKVKPVTGTEEARLRYAAWVEERRRYVSKWSNGRLGFVHIPDMSPESLERLAFDLDAENQAKDGVVVDIRNNRGGFVNGYALDILARKNYINLHPRGRSTATGRAQLGQRALGKPTVLITNQHTLSDGEDFTEGYRALGLGKVVGEPTAGWVIYTSDATLLDGTVFRVPGMKVTTLAGENLERTPRPVDIAVEKPVGESYRDADTQLETAVRTLLAQLKP